MRLHHLGFVVPNIDEHVARMESGFGFRLVAPSVVDPLQGVKVAFVETGTDVSIELLEPLDESSPIAQFLAKGGGLNHLCFSVPDLEAAIVTYREQGSLLVSEPRPAIALQGRHVAFFYSREDKLIELLQDSATEGFDVE